MAPTTLEFKDWKIGGCQYRCEYQDNRTFANSVVFWHHVREDHKVPPQVYRKAHGSGITKTEKMRCAICEEEFLYEFASMKSHFQKKHCLDLREYYDRFVKQAYVPEKTIDKKTESKPQSNSLPAKSAHQHSKPKKQKKAAFTWANQCLYVCHCQFATSSRRDFNGHILGLHDLGVAEYRSLHGDFRATTNYHVCNLCGQTVVHSYDDLSVHFARHNNKLVDYHKRYITGDGPSSAKKAMMKPEEDNKENYLPMKTINIEEHKESLFTTKKIPRKLSPKIIKIAENTEIYSAMKNKDIVKVKESSSATNMSMQISPPSPNKKKIAGDKDNSSPTKKRPTLKQDKRASMLIYYWLNKCVYHCEICGKKTKRLTDFNLHILRRHDMGMEEYRGTYGECRLKTEYHACRFCDLEIVNDAKHVARHVTKKHNTTMLAYHELYYASQHKNKLQNDVKSSTASAAPKVLTVQVANAKGAPTAAMVNLSAAADCGRIRNDCIMKCTVCSARFSKSDSLLRHMRESHTGFKMSPRTVADAMVRPAFYTCRDCGKSDIFRDIRIITRHVKTHGITLSEYLKRHALNIRGVALVVHTTDQHQNPKQRIENIPPAAADNCQQPNEAKSV